MAIKCCSPPQNPHEKLNKFKMIYPTLCIQHELELELEHIYFILFNVHSNKSSPHSLNTAQLLPIPTATIWLSVDCFSLNEKIKQKKIFVGVWKMKLYQRIQTDLEFMTPSFINSYKFINENDSRDAISHQRNKRRNNMIYTMSLLSLSSDNIERKKKRNSQNKCCEYVSNIKCWKKKNGNYAEDENEAGFGDERQKTKIHK